MNCFDLALSLVISVKIGRGNSSSWPIGCPLICILLIVILLSGVGWLIVFGEQLRFLLEVSLQAAYAK